MNPKGSVTVNINMSELFSPYEGPEEDEDLLYYDGKYKKDEDDVFFVCSFFYCVNSKNATILLRCQQLLLTWN